MRIEMTDPLRAGMSVPSVERAAKQLHQYMSFRAKTEKKGYGLSEVFFAAHLVGGIRCFFGIEVSESGELLSDLQNPRAFAAFAEFGWRR